MTVVGKAFLDGWSTGIRLSHPRRGFEGEANPPLTKNRRSEGPRCVKNQSFNHRGIVPYAVNTTEIIQLKCRVIHVQSFSRWSLLHFGSRRKEARGAPARLFRLGFFAT